MNRKQYFKRCEYRRLVKFDFFICGISICVPNNGLRALFEYYAMFLIIINKFIKVRFGNEKLFWTA